MAEIATIAGVAITIPGLLSASWTILKAVYDLYGQVDVRRTQIGILLDRCGYLIAQLSQHLSEPNVEISPKMKQGARSVEETCESFKGMLENLQRKGFLWCMIKQDKIDADISRIRDKIADSFALFGFLAHIGNDDFQQELQRAREQDRAQLNTKLNQLLANDKLIISTLQNHGGTQNRIEGLLVDILKCVNELQSGPEQTAQAKFLQSARTALGRTPKGQRFNIDISEDWIVSSLDIDFETNDELGHGSFGRVFKGYWNATRVAIKQMYSADSRALTDADRKIMYKEVRLWSKLHHRNILNLYGACLEETYPFLVMQYCSLGNLRNYLVDHPTAHRIDMIHDIVAGVRYLHDKNIVHADLKAVNILVDDSHRALVTDFGLSLAIDGIRSRSTMSRADGGLGRGTLQWMAPECLDGEASTKASDIYSLAVTMWEIFSGEIPWGGTRPQVLFRLVGDQGRRPSRPELLTQDAVWSIIQNCWAQAQDIRPTIKRVQVLLEPFTTRLNSNPRRFEYSVDEMPHRAGADYTPGPRSREEEASLIEQQSQREWTASLRSGPPKWTRGNPKSFIDALTIPTPPAGRRYKYRVVKGGVDLGVKPTYELNADGSQTVNLLEYNSGYGIADRTSIDIYAADEDDPVGDEALVAHWG